MSSFENVKLFTNLGSLKIIQFFILFIRKKCKPNENEKKVTRIILKIFQYANWKSEFVPLISFDVNRKLFALKFHPETHIKFHVYLAFFSYIFFKVK